MKTDLVQIGDMILRVPGLSAEEGRLLGHEIVRLVANGLPPQRRPRELGAMALRVNIPQGTPRNRLGLVIAEAILKGLV